jgi:hypothetical protein
MLEPYRMYIKNKIDLKFYNYENIAKIIPVSVSIILEFAELLNGSASVALDGGVAAPTTFVVAIE